MEYLPLIGSLVTVALSLGYIHMVDWKDLDS